MSDALTPEDPASFKTELRARLVGRVPSRNAPAASPRDWIRSRPRPGVLRVSAPNAPDAPPVAHRPGRNS